MNNQLILKVVKMGKLKGVIIPKSQEREFKVKDLVILQNLTKLIKRGSKR